jgi:hypothetical protein
MTRSRVAANDERTAANIDVDRGSCTGGGADALQIDLSDDRHFGADRELPGRGRPGAGHRSRRPDLIATSSRRRATAIEASRSPAR